MEHQEYQAAGAYWQKIDAQLPTMPAEALYDAMVEYIKANDTCGLATVFQNQPRITPIEYIFHNDTFYIFTEGGEKFFALEENKKVALAIFDKFAGFTKLKGLQIQGTATVVDFGSGEYKLAAAVKKLNLDALAKRNTHLHLIAIKPTDATFLNSDFKTLGYHVRQHYQW